MGGLDNCGSTAGCGAGDETTSLATDDWTGFGNSTLGRGVGGLVTVGWTAVIVTGRLTGSGGGF